jgi:hypothetical protein
VDGVFLAHDLDQSGVSEYGTSPLQAVSSVLRWDARMTMRVPTGLGGDTRLFARAGDTFYGRAGKSLVALKLTGDTPAVRVAWRHEVAARPTSVIPAEGRLFAALEDGTLLCFGKGPGRAIEPAEADFAAVQPSASDALPAVDSPSDGFFIALGGLSAEETEHLLQQTGLRLMVISDDGDERRRASAAGRFGNVRQPSRTFHRRPVGIPSSPLYRVCAVAAGRRSGRARRGPVAAGVGFGAALRRQAPLHRHRRAKLAVCRTGQSGGIAGRGNRRR